MMMMTSHTDGARPAGVRTFVLLLAVAAGDAEERDDDDDEDDAEQRNDHQEPPLTVERLVRRAAIVCNTHAHTRRHHTRKHYCQ